VINWVRRFQETGSVAPGQMGGHKPKVIAGEHHAWRGRPHHKKYFETCAQAVMFPADDELALWGGSERGF
jgi:transposase